MAIIFDESGQDVLDESSFIVYDEEGAPVIVQIKNATQWFNPNRQGYVVNLGTVLLTDNAGHFLIDQFQNFLATTPALSTPNNKTSWTTSNNKEATQWLNPNRQGYVVEVGAAFLNDNSGNFLVDQHGNFLLTTPNLSIPSNATPWTQTLAS